MDDHPGESVTATGVILGGSRYGYEDDVYGSCSCGELSRHRHECPDCGSTSSPDGLRWASVEGSGRLCGECSDRHRGGHSGSDVEASGSPS